MLRFLAGMLCVVLGLLIVSQAMVPMEVLIPGPYIETPRGLTQSTELAFVYPIRFLFLGLPVVLAGAWLLLTAISSQGHVSSCQFSQ